MAYLLTDRKTEQTCVVIDGREGPAFEIAGRPALSRDGRVCAYWAFRNDEYFVRIGEREEPSCDFVIDPVVSADGSTVAYAGERGGQWFLIIGAEKRAISGRPVMVFVSADGRQAGWIERRENSDGGFKMRVVVFGKTGETFGLVGTPEFSPAGDLVTYGAEEEKLRFVVIGERKIETPDRVGDPTFSPDGRKVGYGARIGRELWWKVLDVSSFR